MQQLKQKFEQAGQGHVFKFFDELDDSQKKALIEQLEMVDLQELDYLNKTLVFAENTEAGIDFEKLLPAPYASLPKDKNTDTKWLEAKQVGEEAIKAGKLAAFVVAGGQGTRLGFNAPKGLYKVTPVKEKSLFQVFAEKILSASKKYGVSIPWIVMTSHINNNATVEFFEANNYFGLNKNDVIFFKQGLMPAVDLNGKIILEDKGKIAMTPDGHGGCLRGMVRSGAIAELKKRGIECVSYFQVDNPLVDIIDPYFVGFHLLGKSDMSSKMIAKAYPLEKVGHFCMLENKLTVVEYSDLPNEYQEQVDENGKLKFIAGSVAIHIVDVNFIEKLGSSQKAEDRLPFHRANKKIPYIDENGTPVKPEKPNGVKFEMFVFDALPMAENPVIIEGFRGDEFSPVKNAEGLDSPLTCKNHQKAQWRRWFANSGVEIEANEDGVPNIDIEVSPLFATNQTDFTKAWNGLEVKPSITDKLYLQ
ncbi:MAG: UDPGP type 1 family protein [Opitutales bacterium]|nr:UDPGP type 1 family protein [Opitutales bacterium]